MLSLLVSLVLLGLAAVDPVGIAAMPLLLSQPNGLRRSVWFLLGSAVGIIALGVVAAVGAGRVLLRWTDQYPWLEPSFEIACGVALALFGVYLWRRGPQVEVSATLRRRLDLPGITLFGFGAGLVIVQSLLDAVFLVAMVNIGANHLPLAGVVLAVSVYTLAALTLQIALVAAYVSASPQQRDVVIDAITRWLDRYGARAAWIASLGVGALLVASGVSALNGGPTLG